MMRTPPPAALQLCLLGLALLGSAACARRAVIPIDPAGLRREWTLVQLRDSDGEAVLVPNSRMTLRFMEDGRVAGRSSINQFGGTVEILSDGMITWSSLTSTLMAGPQELMTQERRYIAALQSTRRFRLDNTRLVLSDRAERIVLSFVPTDSAGR